MKNDIMFNMINKKIAVFHNCLDTIGGAEVVVLTLARGLNADVYTTNIDTDKITKMGFADVLPRIISLGKIPLNPPFRQQLAFWKFRKLNLGKKYDFYIIAGDWAMSGAVNNHPNMWYAHSPLNELWQLKNYAKSEMMVWWQRPLFDIWVWFNRTLSLKYSKYVDVWVCTSENTKNRIKRFYNKEATIINPPINNNEFSYHKNGDFWLSVNRLCNYKRVDMQIKAFKNLPDDKLVIVGPYENNSVFVSYKNYCEKIKPGNVEIIHQIERTALLDLYADCKGFIATTKNEDFGMTPIEAMASGKPVVAPNEGGHKETIINGKTGILINDINEEKIIEAIKEINKNPKQYKEACQMRAKEFDTEIFLEKIKKEIEICLKK